MDIQILHMQNNAYRDLIADLKRNINELDKKIQINEIEIGWQLEQMSHDSPGSLSDCTFCLGECQQCE